MENGDRKKLNKTGMTSSVLKQNPNTGKVRKNAVYKSNATKQLNQKRINILHFIFHSLSVCVWVFVVVVVVVVFCCCCCCLFVVVFVFVCLLLVLVFVFCSLIKGLTSKIRMLCFLTTDSVLFNF